MVLKQMKFYFPPLWLLFTLQIKSMYLSLVKMAPAYLSGLILSHNFLCSLFTSLSHFSNWNVSHIFSSFGSVCRWCISPHACVICGIFLILYTFKIKCHFIRITVNCWPCLRMFMFLPSVLTLSSYNSYLFSITQLSLSKSLTYVSQTYLR